jgi:hypothetical protein
LNFDWFWGCKNCHSTFGCYRQNKPLGSYRWVLTHESSRGQTFGCLAITIQLKTFVVGFRWKKIFSQTLFLTFQCPGCNFPTDFFRLRLHACMCIWIQASIVGAAWTGATWKLSTKLARFSAFRRARSPIVKRAALLLFWKDPPSALPAKVGPLQRLHVCVRGLI